MIKLRKIFFFLKYYNTINICLRLYEYKKKKIKIIDLVLLIKYYIIISLQIHYMFNTTIVRT